MGFETYMEAHPDKVKSIVRDLIIDSYKMTLAGQVAVDWGEGQKLGIILKMPDSELNMTLFLPHGRNTGQVLKVRACDFEDDLVLGVEILEDLGLLDLNRISRR